MPTAAVKKGPVSSSKKVGAGKEFRSISLPVNTFSNIGPEST